MKKVDSILEEVNNLYALYDLIAKIPNRSWYPPHDGYHGCEHCATQSDEIFVATFRIVDAKLRISFVPAKKVRESYILDTLEVSFNGKLYDNQTLKRLCPWFTRNCFSDPHFWVSEALIKYYRQICSNTTTSDTAGSSGNERVLQKPTIPFNVDIDKIRQAIKEVKVT